MPNLDFSAFSVLETGDSLEHYGRKGMHWYEHIFGKEQSHAKYAKSGTKKSSSISSKKEERKKEKARKEAQRKAKKERAEKEKKEAIRKAILKSPSKLYKHRDEFTKEEIDAAIENFEMEKKLKDFAKTDIQRGADMVQSMFKITTNGISVYNSVARIYNSLGDPNDRIPYIENIQDRKDEKKK